MGKLDSLLSFGFKVVSNLGRMLSSPPPQASSHGVAAQATESAANHHDLPDEQPDNNHPVQQPTPTAAVPAPIQRDIAAEIYFSECVNNPHADFCIDYPPRVYHLKPRFGPSYSSSPDDAVLNSVEHWQSTFLWQPVILPATTTDGAGGGGENPLQQLRLRRRPMRGDDKTNTAYFLWFRPHAPPSLSHDDDNKDNSNDGPALGFRPWLDMLFLDTAFLEAYLFKASPADHVDPLRDGSPFFPFLPRSARERAKVKIVALAAEPLCRATFVPDEVLRAREAYDEQQDNVVFDHEEQEQARRRTARRERHEAHDLRCRRLTIARLLVAVFPGLERIYLVAMASVPLGGSNPKTATEFSKMGSLQGAILAEHRQVLSQRTKNNNNNRPYRLPSYSPRQRHHIPDPDASLYRHALQWNLVPPIPPNLPPRGDLSPTSAAAAASSVPRLFERDMRRAREEVWAILEWREEAERERADPALRVMRYERERAISFLGPWWWPGKEEEDREKQEKYGVEVLEVEAEPMVMMYFADKFRQATEAGWDPGDTIDVAHLFVRPPR